MTPVQEELFDTALLRVLDANRTRFGLNAEAVSIHMGVFGFPGADRERIKDRLDYLAQKGLVSEVLKDVNKANRCWRLTDVGLQYVDSRSFP